jgi:hypothetical protein
MYRVAAIDIVPYVWYYVHIANGKVGIGGASPKPKIPRWLYGNAQIHQKTATVYNSVLL